MSMKFFMTVGIHCPECNDSIEFHKHNNASPEKGRWAYGVHAYRKNSTCSLYNKDISVSVPIIEVEAYDR